MTAEMNMRIKDSFGIFRAVPRVIVKEVALVLLCEEGGCYSTLIITWFYINRSFVAVSSVSLLSGT